MSAGGRKYYRDPPASDLLDRASHARLSPFPLLRTPATQATFSKNGVVLFINR